MLVSDCLKIVKDERSSGITIVIIIIVEAAR